MNGVLYFKDHSLRLHIKHNHGVSDSETSPMENLAILEMNDWETILVVFKSKNHLGTQQSNRT